MGEPGTKEILNLEDLQAAGAQRTGRRHVLSLLVENKPGVLARISGLFARRGYNIDSLAVGPTDDTAISRITLTVDGASHSIDQVTKQLHKLINVIKIRDLEPAEAVSRELALFKISADGDSRGQIIEYAEIFRGRIVDVSKRSVTVEVSGADDKIEAFERMCRPFGLIEMVRTGEIAVSEDGSGNRSGADPRCAEGGLSRLLLLLRRRAERHVRRCKPGAARTPRGSQGADRRAGGHHPSQRRPRGRRSSR